MARNYPHINDTQFPDLDSVDAYKYENNFQYSRYKEGIRIKLLRVSWDSGYDNAVYFESKAERDSWFEAEKGKSLILPTMFRLYNDGTIKVDIPVDECMDYNYVMVDYGKLPQQGMFSDQRRMFYFIDSCTQNSPNTTTLNVSVDWWTCFINDMDISYVNLVRGHAPMAETTVDEYLADPIGESELMLTEDVSYGYLQRTASQEAVTLNDGKTGNPTWLGILSTADLEATWSSGGKRIIPVQNYYTDSQYPNCVDFYVVEIDSTHTFEGFKQAVNSTCPQLWKSIRGICLVPKCVLNVSNSFKFCGFTAHNCDTVSDKVQGTFDITKAKFAYPRNIAWIPKLYTYPYAAIEVNDYNGNSFLVKVEDTCGSLKLHTNMCDIYPFLNVEGYLEGIGKRGTVSVSFKHMYSETFHVGGSGGQTVTWNIPIMGVQLTVEQDWELRSKLHADAVLANAEDTAANGVLEAENSATRNHADSLVGVNQAVDNYTRDASYANNMYILQGKENALAYGQESKATSVAVTAGMANGLVGMVTTAGSNIGASYYTYSMGDGKESTVGSAQIGSVGSAVNFALSTATDLVSTNAIQGVNRDAFVMEYGGAAGYDFPMWPDNPAVTASQFVPTTDGLKGQMLAENLDCAYDKTSINNEAAMDFADNMQKSEIHHAQLQSALAVGGTVQGKSLSVPAGNSATLEGAAYSGNANRSYDAGHQQTLIDNPGQYGQMTGDPGVVSKPMGLMYNVLTQSKNAIRQAAEQFLRYGYALNMQWKVDSFNIMSKFTYWQADHVYTRAWDGNGVFEGAQLAVKAILAKGVTVWRDPHEIGKKSIYENEVPSE